MQDFYMVAHGDPESYVYLGSSFCSCWTHKYHAVLCDLMDVCCSLPSL